MKQILSLLLLAVFVGCSTTPPPVTPPPPIPPTTNSPPPFQSWTNATRLPDGQLSTGIAIYLRAPASPDLLTLLRAAGAVQKSETAWVISQPNLNDARIMAVLTAVGHAGGHLAPHTP